MKYGGGGRGEDKDGWAATLAAKNKNVARMGEAAHCGGRQHPTVGMIKSVQRANHGFPLFQNEN
jgi:hypothetical protein